MNQTWFYYMFGRNTMLFNLYGHYVQQQKAVKELHNETKKKEDKAWLFSLKSKPSLNMNKKGKKEKSMTKS